MGKLTSEQGRMLLKFSAAKAALAGEAVECLLDRGYDVDEIKTEAGGFLEEFLLVNEGTAALPKWEFVYKVEALGEDTDDGFKLSGVKGYWMKTVLDRIPTTTTDLLQNKY